jgi:cytochrome d ubiquinol oxidase subunit II
MSALQTTWFFLIGVLLIGYAVLDGFDLGVGIWHLFAKNDGERRVLLNSIGPVWDGNEVWLLTGGGALFAAFPPVYATVFSGFYLALMLLLLGLILRAVSLEFRSKVEGPRWRTTWDVVFSISSAVAALLLGVALGNVLRGIPIDDRGNSTVTFLGLLNPYALVVGLMGLAMIATHGAVYVTLKAEDDLAARARRWALGAWALYLALYLAATAYTLVGQPHLVGSYADAPALFAVPALALAAIVAIPVLLRRGGGGAGGRGKRAFVASSLSIAALMATAGLSLYPTIVPALGAPARSLTIENSSSSQYTLTVMLVVALVGMPLVLGYTVFVYRTFRGKVRLDDHSY